MALVAFLLYLAIHYWDPFIHLLGLVLAASKPLLIGCVIAYVVNIPMSFYEKHYFPNSASPWVSRTKRGICMLLAFLSVVAVIYAVLQIVIPELVRCVRLLMSGLPDMIEYATNFLSGLDLFGDEGIASDFADIDWNATISKALNLFAGGISNAADLAMNLATKALSFSMDFVIALIFSLYLLAEKESLYRQFQALLHRYVNAGWIAGIMHVLQVANHSFSSFVTGQCTEAVILGVLCALGMVIFRFPYAAVVGATIGLTALIPVAGAYIGGAVGFLLILSVSPFKAFMFLIYLVVLQQIEGNLIYPKVVGTSMGLPGIWVLAAVIIGGGIGGIGGMVLSVPLASCIYQLVREDVYRPDTLAVPQPAAVEPRLPEHENSNH